MKHTPALGYDLEGIRRVARVLLRHVQPETPTDAYDVLDGRLGVYVADRTILSAEIDRYFGGDDVRCAA